MSNPLHEIQRLGQSTWFDNIGRGLITSGELQRMVTDDGLSGVTSNPAIFEKSIAGTHDYDPAMKALVRGGAASAREIYERLAIEDIQWAADVLYPVFRRTQGQDGFVSLEVSPELAHDTQGSIEEGRRLFAAVGRENVMIKIPGTPEGIPAVRQLVGEGIHVNVTLLFAVETYELVALAWMEGLEELIARGGDPRTVASVASFFISRIDTLADERLAALAAAAAPEQRGAIEALRGKAAVANGIMAYARMRDIYASERWQALAERGAQLQRILWASTSTKNPLYARTMYVDSLIAPLTVNTLPAETFAEFRERGKVRGAVTDRWEEAVAEARGTMAALAKAGLSMREVTDALVEDGVKKFMDPFGKLLAAIESKRLELSRSEYGRLSWDLGSETAAAGEALDGWRDGAKIARLWADDPTLWTGSGEEAWLGWLHALEGPRGHVEEARALAAEVAHEGLGHIVLLGMGGSSLCPDLLRRTFGVTPGHPELLVLDSTVPAQIRALERRVDPSRTLFVVSSKSGSTSEPNAFLAYFHERARAALGPEEARRRFVVITDPGSSLHKAAMAERFRAILHGVPSIGGRYSALSAFGMGPAALMGVDVNRFLGSAGVMAHACSPAAPAAENPGVQLGAVLAALAARGRDKLTFVVSPGCAALGAWLEQLIAESTGKLGKGIVPVDQERLGAPAAYGADRLFVYTRLRSRPSPQQDEAVERLAAAGHPVVRIELRDPMDLGQEFFRWEVATAVAGSTLGLNPFDQPDVEASKIATRRYVSAFEETGALPEEPPVYEGDGVRLFARGEHGAAIARAAARGGAAAALAAHLATLRKGDYFAVNAFIEMNAENDSELQALRHAVRDARRTATTLGYGPRFLHSTGQLHKGGPNSGVFLQLTSDDAEDLAIPRSKVTFGVMKQAQALGDFEVLAARDRRVLRVHLGADVAAELARLRTRVAEALG